MGYLLYNTKESLHICQEPAALGFIGTYSRNFNIAPEFKQPNCQGKERVLHVERGVRTQGCVTVQDKMTLRRLNGFEYQTLSIADISTVLQITWLPCSAIEMTLSRRKVGWVGVVLADIPAMVSAVMNPSESPPLPWLPVGVAGMVPSPEAR